MPADLICGQSRNFSLSGDITGESLIDEDDAVRAAKAMVGQAMAIQIGELFLKHQCQPPCNPWPVPTQLGSPSITIVTSGIKHTDRYTTSYYGTSHKWAHVEDVQSYWATVHFDATITLTCIPIPESAKNSEGKTPKGKSKKE